MLLISYLYVQFHEQNRYELMEDHDSFIHIEGKANIHGWSSTFCTDRKEQVILQELYKKRAKCLPTSET